MWLSLWFMLTFKSGHSGPHRKTQKIRQWLWPSDTTSIIFKKEGNSCLACPCLCLAWANCQSETESLAFSLHFREMEAIKLVQQRLRCPAVRWGMSASCSVPFKLHVNKYHGHLGLDIKPRHHSGPVFPCHHTASRVFKQCAGCLGSQQDGGVGRKIRNPQGQTWSFFKKEKGQWMKTNELCSCSRILSSL